MHAGNDGEDEGRLRGGSSRAITHSRDPVLCTVLTASWSTSSLVRGKLTDWLRAHAWPPDELDDVVLVVSEADSNAVEYGYRLPRDGLGGSAQTVRMMARLRTTGDGRRYLDISINDRGRWRPPHSPPTWTPTADVGYSSSARSWLPLRSTPTPAVPRCACAPTPADRQTSDS